MLIVISKQNTPCSEVFPLMNYYTTELKQCQVVRPVDSRFLLHDTSASGRERPWREKKMANELLSAAYEEIDPSKAARLRECASVLVFNVDPDGGKHLHSMTSCRVRLCPMCQWRRSLRVYQDMLKTVDYLATKKKYKYILLTLTFRNVFEEDLIATIDQMMDAINRMTQRAQFKRCIKGWYRALEVTHHTQEFLTYKKSGRLKRDENGNPIPDPWYKSFHPHFHLLLAVNDSYGHNEYINAEDWNELWRSAMRLDYAPDIDIKTVKGDLREAVTEISKYTAKDSDYIIPYDWDLTVDTVRILDKALANRRLISYGGCIAEARRALNLESEETADLIHVDGDSVSADVVRQVVYFWSSGYNNYIGHLKE